MDSLRLIVPSVDWRDAYESLTRECMEDADLPTSGFTFRPKPDFADFAGFVRLLEDWEAGVRLAPGYLPESTYWAVVGSRIIGIARLRHYLDAESEQDGGHIGYMIRRSERRKGYGAALLGLVLEKARERGLERVLITCNADNEGSAGVILKNGGVEAERFSPEVRRFWITLQP